MALLDAAYILAAVRSLLAEYSSIKWTDDHINKWVQEAAIDISMKTLGYEDTDSITTAANTLEYTDPSGCIKVHSCIKGGLRAGNDAYTVLLIHSDDTDGSITFVDSGNGPNCPHTITPDGDAHHETDEKKFGISSIYFDGTGTPLDRLSIPDSSDWDLTPIFTIDFWFKTNTANQCCLLNTGNANSANEYQIELNRTAGKLSVYSSGQKCITTNSWNDGFWHYLALVCDGTDLKMYIDGTQDAEELNYAPNWAPTGMYIGSTYTEEINEPYAGYMDEIRISKGIARWTSNFTPPIAPYDSFDTDYKGLSQIHPRLIHHVAHNETGEPIHYYHHHGKTGIWPLPDDIYIVTAYSSKVTHDITDLPSELRLLAIPYCLAIARLSEGWEDDFEMFITMYLNSVMAYRPDRAQYKLNDIDVREKFRISLQKVINV